MIGEIKEANAIGIVQRGCEVQLQISEVKEIIRKWRYFMIMLHGEESAQETVPAFPYTILLARVTIAMVTRFELI